MLSKFLSWKYRCANGKLQIPQLSSRLSTTSERALQFVCKQHHIIRVACVRLQRNITTMNSAMLRTKLPCFHRIFTLTSNGFRTSPYFTPHLIGNSLCLEVAQYNSPVKKNVVLVPFRRDHDTMNLQASNVYAEPAVPPAPP